jgi:hypothetical protein
MALQQLLGTVDISKIIQPHIRLIGDDFSVEP